MKKIQRVLLIQPFSSDPEYKLEQVLLEGVPHQAPLGLGYIASYLNSRIPEIDVDRTSEEGKASSVQFIHFNFSDKQIKKFRNLNNQVTIGIDHHLYNHMTKISENNRNALMKDFI